MDSVIFGFFGEKLKILILETINTGPLLQLSWCFIRKDEDLDNCGETRTLRADGNWSKFTWTQFNYVWRTVIGPNQEVWAEFFEAQGNGPEDHWRFLVDLFQFGYFAFDRIMRTVATKPTLILITIGGWYKFRLPTGINAKITIQDCGESPWISVRSLDQKSWVFNLLPGIFTMERIYRSLWSNFCVKSTEQISNGKCSR